MRSPCLNCELVDQDKDNPTCEKCTDRIDYLIALDPENICRWEWTVSTVQDYDDMRYKPAKKIETIKRLKEFGKYLCGGHDLADIMNTRVQRGVIGELRRVILTRAYREICHNYTTVGQAFGVSPECVKNANLEETEFV